MLLFGLCDRKLELVLQLDVLKYFGWPDDVVENATRYRLDPLKLDCVLWNRTETSGT